MHVSRLHGRARARALPLGTGLDDTGLQILGTNATLGSLARDMAKNEGVLSFYKGLAPFCTQLVLKYAIRWSVNDFFVGHLQRLGMSNSTGGLSLAGGFVSGLGTGLVEAIVLVTPLERIKTLLQQQRSGAAAGALASPSGATPVVYKGMLDCAIKVSRHSKSGLRSLWRGNVATMVRQGWNQAFLFGTYGPMKKLLYGKERDAPISSMQSSVIGFVAGALGPLTNNPIDVAKSRMQAQGGSRYKTMLGCIVTVFREEGGKALMRGVSMRIARVAPGMGITFTMVEKWNVWFAEY